MLPAALIWIYKLIISYIIGLSVLKIIGRGESYIVKSEISILLVGFCSLIVYSEIFSLVYKVGLWANIVLVVITLALGIVNKTIIRERLSALRSEITVFGLVAVLVLFVFMTYGTSHGYMHYDTDLYHAQSIRWIEEYGVVKGLGNLQSRLAYNSSAFCISALFSFSFLGLQSFHVCAGYLAFLIAMLCGKMINKSLFSSFKVSSLIRIAAIFYLLTIFDEMVSPASDYFVALLIFGLVIIFADLLEEECKDPYPYALLGILGLCIFSVKISGAFILLTALYPAYLLIKDKNIKGIIKYITVGIFSIIPFFVRNIILSGYLIYPVPSIDIFNFDFKISSNMAEYDANEIEVFGRGHSDLSRIDEPLSNWIFQWFGQRSAIDKAAIILTLVSVVVICVYIFVTFVSKKYNRLPYVLLSLTIIFCFFVWIVTSPNIRFGCVFIYLAPMITFGLMYRDYLSKIDRLLCYRLFLIGFLGYKALGFGREFISHFSLEYLLTQQDYGHYEAAEYELHGIKFYYPLEGDRMGYEYFPSSPMKAEDIFIGNSIKDGFKDVIH